MFIKESFNVKVCRFFFFFLLLLLILTRLLTMFYTCRWKVKLATDQHNRQNQLSTYLKGVCFPFSFFFSFSWYDSQFHVLSFLGNNPVISILFSLSQKSKDKSRVWVVSTYHFNCVIAILTSHSHIMIQ